MKDIGDEICKDTPQKTDINKPYIDNIDAYDRHLLNTSLSNRLDLGQNSLTGAKTPSIIFIMNRKCIEW